MKPNERDFFEWLNSQTIEYIYTYAESGLEFTIEDGQIVGVKTK